MNQIAIGQRMPMRQIDINTNEPVTLKLTRHSQSKVNIDISCFALDINGKLINEDYVVFHKQPASPCGQVQLTHYEADTAPGGTQAEFKVSLSQLPYSVDSLFFVLSGATSLNSIDAVDIGIWQQSQKAFVKYQSSDFTRQKASMLMQLYRKGGIWRLSNVCQSVNGGLGGVAHQLGANSDTFTSKPCNDESDMLALVNYKAPQLTNLAEKSAASLVKKGLKKASAKVVLALEASGSMRENYINGQIQQLVDRFTAMAFNFDVNQSFDCWAFAGEPASLGTVTLENHLGFVSKSDGQNLNCKAWPVGNRGSNETKMMRSLIDTYVSKEQGHPVYILLVSDGSIKRNSEISTLLKSTQHLPVFWQVLGYNGFDYGNLKKLGLSGVGIGNCGFFEIENLNAIGKERLYDAMLHEFSVWLKKATRAGVVDI